MWFSGQTKGKNMRTFKRTTIVAFVAVTLVVFSTISIIAGDTVLSNNTGSGRAPWVITGESSLVINGFDLNASGISLPTTLDRISIDVAVAVPGDDVIAVVYQDANGGSPLDATLVRQETTSISITGTYTYTFTTPVEITQPVIWVGFYLPVGFEFLSDTSGSSVLTYWAWEPNSTFDLTSLANASVLGPSDGSAPVGLDIGGVARISAELVTGNGTTTPDTTATPGASGPPQITGPEGISLAPLVNYFNCDPIYYDSEDIRINLRSSVRYTCKSYTLRFNPPEPEGYTFRSLALYDLTAYGPNVVSPGTNPLKYPVTHCIAPPPADLPNAVIGLAYGAPREWEILPTVRFGDVICAEVFYSGYIGHFVPN